MNPTANYLFHMNASHPFAKCRLCNADSKDPASIELTVALLLTARSPNIWHTQFKVYGEMTATFQ
jgi:hypothetical protein